MSLVWIPILGLWLAFIAVTIAEHLPRRSRPTRIGYLPSDFDWTYYKRARPYNWQIDE